MSLGGAPFASWAAQQQPQAINPIQNGFRADAIFGHPTVIRHDSNIMPYFGVNTSHRELEDTNHGPWARGKSRVLFFEAVVQNLIGMEQRGVFKVFPPKETDSIEVVIQRTEYDAFEASPAPEHQPVKLVSTKGGAWTVRTERFGIGFKCGRLWGRQPGSKQEIQYGINQGKDAFLNKAEWLIHQRFLETPDLLQMQYILRNRGGNRMSANELVSTDAAFFGAMVRLETPVADMMQEAAHYVKNASDELDTLILPRGSVQHLSRRLFALMKASEVGEQAYRDKFALTGNNELVIGKHKVYDSRRCDILRAHFNHTEPLAELAVTGTFWTFDSQGAANTDGIWIHDNDTDRLAFISLQDMRDKAYGAARGNVDAKFLILRPNDRRYMGSAILTRQGGDVGFTNICHEGIEVSHNGDTEFSKFSMRMHIGPVVVRPELIMRIANVSYVPGGYIQGGGSKVHHHNNPQADAYQAIYMASRDDDNRADIVIIAFAAGVVLPSSSFYPSQRWGEGGEATGVDAAVTGAIHQGVFGGKVKSLHHTQIFSPDAKTREEGGYYVPLSPGFCIRKDGAAKTVIPGNGREGKYSIPGSCAAREMRLSPATPFISDATAPSEQVILQFAH